MCSAARSVHEGELLATLENSDLAAAALDNQGSYTAAQATFETATKATVPEDLTKARLDLAQAKANLDLAQSIVTARSQLFSQGAIPGRDLDTAKAALVESQATYDIAKEHFDSMQSVSHKAALENAQGNLDSAKGKYLGAQAELSYTEIRSPISGVVTDRPLFAGETAAAGTPAHHRDGHLRADRQAAHRADAGPAARDRRCGHAHRPRRR